MANFVMKDKLTHDFEYELLNAIDFLEWFYDDVDHSVYREDDDLPEDFVPVGPIEFVKKFSPIKPPINIPEELRKDKYLKREITIINLSEMPIELEGMNFIKYLDGYKGLTAVLGPDPIEPIAEVTPGRYLISEYIKIQTEYRVFVHKNKIVDIRKYSGDYNAHLDVNLIKDMIYEYDKHFPYTLDVAVSDRGTCLIEIHPFVSCGLYGMNNYNKLIPMTVQGYQWIKEETNDRG